MDITAWLLLILLPFFVAALALLWRFFHQDEQRALEEERRAQAERGAEGAEQSL